MRIKNFTTGETVEIDRSEYEALWRAEGYHIVGGDEPLTETPPDGDDKPSTDTPPDASEV